MIESYVCEDCGKQPRLVSAGATKRPALKCDCNHETGAVQVIYISFRSEYPEEWTVCENIEEADR